MQWSPLWLLLFLHTASGSAQTLTCDARWTYGGGGPRRTASAIAEDQVTASLVIKGMQLDYVESAIVAVSAELLDKDGNVVIDLPKRELEMIPHFGGDQLPISLNLDLPKALPAGSYKFRVKVADVRARKQTEVKLTLKVDGEEQGIHERNLQISYDKKGRVPAFATQSVGQTLYVKCEIAGVQPLDGELDIEVSGELIDRKTGKASAEMKQKRLQSPYQQGKMALVTLSLNELFPTRPGQFEWKLTFTDRKRNQSRLVTVPLHIFEAP